MLPLTTTAHAPLYVALIRIPCVRPSVRPSLRGCRPVHLPLRLGLPLGGGGGDAEHDPGHAAGEPPVGGAAGRGRGLVDPQHQHSAQDGGEGTGGGGAVPDTGVYSATVP